MVLEFIRMSGPDHSVCFVHKRIFEVFFSHSVKNDIVLVSLC